MNNILFPGKPYTCRVLHNSRYWIPNDGARCSFGCVVSSSNLEAGTAILAYRESWTLPELTPVTGSERWDVRVNWQEAEENPSLKEAPSRLTRLQQAIVDRN